MPPEMTRLQGKQVFQFFMLALSERKPNEGAPKIEGKGLDFFSFQVLFKLG